MNSVCIYSHRPLIIIRIYRRLLYSALSTLSLKGIEIESIKKRLPLGIEKGLHLINRDLRISVRSKRVWIGYADGSGVKSINLHLPFFVVRDDSK